MVLNHLFACISSISLSVSTIACLARRLGQVVGSEESLHSIVDDPDLAMPLRSVYELDEIRLLELLTHVSVMIEKHLYLRCPSSEVDFQAVVRFVSVPS